MNIDPTFRSAVEHSFASIKSIPGSSVPATNFLSSSLRQAIDTAGTATTIPIHRDVAAAFTTAAIEVWLRAVHSYLISCSLTRSSPIWASVAGYYSSHYSVRAFAHSMGYFQLFSKKKVVHRDFASGSSQCLVSAKTNNDREHKFYWKVVKTSPQFLGDDLFTHNDGGLPTSDAGHRERGNYADHVNQYPLFTALDKVELQQRTDRIAGIRFYSPPIPRPNSFPDLEAVQVVAYHRLVRYRQLIDEIVGTTHRYWKVHRQPPWIGDFLTFQLTEQGNTPGAVLTS